MFSYFFILPFLTPPGVRLLKQKFTSHKQVINSAQITSLLTKLSLRLDKTLQTEYKTHQTLKLGKTEFVPPGLATQYTVK